MLLSVSKNINLYVIKRNRIEINFSSIIENTLLNNNKEAENISFTLAL